MHAYILYVFFGQAHLIPFSLNHLAVQSAARSQFPAFYIVKPEVPDSLLKKILLGGTEPRTAYAGDLVACCFPYSHLVFVWYLSLLHIHVKTHSPQSRVCLANRSSQSLGAAAQDDSMSFDGGIESSESNALSLSLASPGPETPFRSSNSPSKRGD